PLVAILGGAKVSDKIGVIENLLTTAAKVLVGGGMTFTFMAAQGQEIGKSLLEADKVELAKGLLETAGDKLVLPVDAVVSKEFSNEAPFHTVDADKMPADEMGLDIG
ncbi:phosphoglycerate kinase, partial [Listeria monocytogenes]|nr:phosphoglycerate kinase [Listeria monocytogenes]